jgi:hypothetical protein
VTEPQWQPIPQQPQPQYVPVYAQERQVSVGIAGVVLGIFATGSLVLAVAVPGGGGAALFVLSLIFAFIGAPIAGVALGRRVRRKMPWSTALAGVILCSIPLLMLVLAVVISVTGAAR